MDTHSVRVIRLPISRTDADNPIRKCRWSQWGMANRSDHTGHSAVCYRAARHFAVVSVIGLAGKWEAIPYRS